MTSKNFRNLCLASLLLLSGCGGPQLMPLAPDATILAFGDSLTHGVGASQGNDYPSVLAQLTGRTVVNAGISGETTEQGRQRLDDMLRRHQPQLLILLEGGNDILRNAPAGQTKENLAAMIDSAEAVGVDVILVGVPEKKLFSDAAPLYLELADTYDLVLEDDLIGTLLRRPGLKSDPIHFNDAGYRALAEGLHEVLQDHGAL